MAQELPYVDRTIRIQPEWLALLVGLEILNSSTVGLMSNYFRDIQKVDSNMQQKVTSLLTSCFSELSKGSTGGMGWTAGSDLFTQMSQQIASMAETNAKVFTARGN